MGTIPRPEPSKSGHLPQNPCRFIPTSHPHARLGPLPLPDGSRTFRCRWEGMPPDQARKRQRGLSGGGDGQRGSAGCAVSFGKLARTSHRAGFRFPACDTRAGRGTPVRACGGHGAFSRQGPCRNTRPKHFSRPVQAAAGVTRAEGPEEGQVRKPISASCEAAACRMGTPSGEFRAARA